MYDVAKTDISSDIEGLVLFTSSSWSNVNVLEILSMFIQMDLSTELPEVLLKHCVYSQTQRMIV